MYHSQNKRKTLTKRLLQESLMKLLKEKDLQKISITELCREAGINRTTFYSHYSSQYDVLRDMENTMLQDVQRIIDRYHQDDGEWNLLELIEAICNYLKENLALSRTVLQYNGIESEFASTLFRIPTAYHFASAHLPRHYDEIDRELLLTCFSRGGYSLIRQWLVDDLPKSPNEVARLIYEVATRGWMIQKR